MAATVTNLTQISSADDETWTLAAVAGADQAFPLDSTSNLVGIDGTTNCQQLANGSTPLVNGDWYSAWSGNFAASASYDISATDSQIVLHFKNNSPTYTQISGIRVALFSGGGTTNYGYWDFTASATILNGLFWPLVCQGTPDGTGGTFDNTDVTGIAFLAQAGGTGGFAHQISIDQAIHHSGPVVFEDTGAAATVTMEDYYDLLKPTSGTTYHSMLVARAGSTFEFGFPIDIQADDYDDSSAAVGVAFKATDGVGFPAMPADFYSLNITGQASGSIVFENAQFATLSSEFNCTVDGSAASTSISLTSALLAAVDGFTCTGSGVTISGSTVSAPDTCTLSGYAGSLTINDAVATIEMSADLTAGATLTTNSDLLIDFAGTDLSDLNLDFTANNTVTVSPTAGSQTYNVAGMTSTGSVEFDNDTANNTTVQVATELTYTVASPTTGGGTVTVSSPPVTITVSNTNLVDGTKYLLRNETQDDELEIGTVTGGGGYTSGTLTRGTDYDNGDTLTLYGTYQNTTNAKENYSESAVGGATNIEFVGTQDDWDAYTDIGIDGATVDQANGGECTIDGTSIQIDVNDADNSTTKKRIMAWIVYAQTTDYGIRNWFGALNLIDASNGLWDQTVADIDVSNEKVGTTLEIKDPASLRKLDGSSMISGSTYNIEWEVSGLVNQVSTGSGLSPAQDASLSAIESKTSGLTYTVANQVDSNIQYVNDVQVTGTGAAGDEWGP